MTPRLATNKQNKELKFEMDTNMTGYFPMKTDYTFINETQHFFCCDLFSLYNILFKTQEKFPVYDY